MRFDKVMKTNTLKLIAAYGSVAVIGGGFYFNYKIQDTFRKTEYYRESMKLLRRNRKAVEVLGEPIKEGRMDLGDTTNNNVDGLNAKLAIPVRGPKAKGTMYMAAEREKYGIPYNLTRVELELKDDSTRRLIVYKNVREVETVDQMQ